MGDVDQGDIRIVFQRLLYLRKVRKLRYRKLQVDMRQPVCFADLYRTGGVGAVIDHKDLLICRQKRV